jgi:hypothetical protein
MLMHCHRRALSAAVANGAHRVREDAPELVKADLANEQPAPDVEQDISLGNGEADRGFGAVNHGFGSFVVARGCPAPISIIGIMPNSLSILQGKIMGRIHLRGEAVR